MSKLYAICSMNKKTRWMRVWNLAVSVFTGDKAPLLVQLVCLLAQKLILLIFVRLFPVLLVKRLLLEVLLEVLIGSEIQTPLLVNLALLPA